MQQSWKERSTAESRPITGGPQPHLGLLHPQPRAPRRPLPRVKVDVVIGNPPWLNYNQTVSTLRTELERQSAQDLYGIWTRRRLYALCNQDVAGYFFARCVDLYLKDGGVIGMVMPNSALQSRASTAEVAHR